MIDVSQQETAPPSVLRYINYTTLFLTFVSGPIQRWQDHDAQMQSPPVEASNLQLERGVARAALGYLYIVVCDRLAVREYPFFSDHFKLYLTAHSWLSATVYLAATASLFLLHLYLNFAGYMNVVIGIGVLAGLRLPENFNSPFRTANFVELWSRWHITLSEWFKIYLFNPLLKAMGRRWGDTVPMAYLGAISFFITFAVMGQSGLVETDIACCANGRSMPTHPGRPQSRFFPCRSFAFGSMPARRRRSLLSWE
jgi:alginate O-acetyltransferase complex protein AlgI